MFSPAPMMRLSVVLLEQDEEAVLRDLGELGAVELICTQTGPETAPLPPHNRTAEISLCDGLRTRVENLRHLLQIPLHTANSRSAEMTLNQAENALQAIEDKAAALFKQRERLMHRQSELTALSQQVSGYRGLDIPLADFDRYSFLHFITGNLPPDNFAALAKQVDEHVALLPLPPHEGRQQLIAMTTHDRRDSLENLLQQAGFQQEKLPAREGATMDSLAREVSREQEQLSVELASIRVELQSLATRFPLSELYCLATDKRRLLEAEQNFPRTESTLLLTGWIVATEVPTLARRLIETTRGRCIIQSTPPANRFDDQIPVLLRQPRWLRPFQMLVSAYGLPLYHELEPTLFVAVSYVLMFGMMFGDAGHGAVLAIGGLVALLTSHTAKLRDAGLLLLTGGLSSIGFGITYGSFFGIERFKQYALCHDPLAGDSMALMQGAVGIGVAMISLGLILNVINRFRRGDLIGGFLGKFGLIGILFYWGGLVLTTKFSVIESVGLVNASVFIFLIIPLACWTLKEPLEYLGRRRAAQPVGLGNGLFAAITESSVAAFEAVLSYLANTISFVRLAAYAMSHAALLAAAFMMAAEVKHLSPGGGALSLAVVVLGNLIAIVLEGIIAAVQALRLEYYEFFGKFFSGTGRPFAPFRLSTALT